MGLTYSWNLGYKLAKFLGYSYVFFANNDIIIPAGAINLMRASLKVDALVVPLTTK